MTQDEIIKMAKQVGLWPAVTDTFPKELEAFAKLIVQHEREACAALCEWRTGIQQVDAAIDTCAAAIRARSNP
jgi:hypothetical protein